jgi:adenylate cyclase
LSTETLAAEQLVEALHEFFTEYDRIIARYGLEKLKTIGDSYMFAGGLPVRSSSHPVDALLAAFELIEATKRLGRQNLKTNWRVRIGVHTGPVIAGVVGIRKFAFDIWGDSVNFSSRMESSGAPDRINISPATYTRVKDFFACEPRGKIKTKDKRKLDMYFVNGITPDLLAKSPGSVAAFERRYRIYFHKDLTAFPEFLLHDSGSDLEQAAPAPDANCRANEDKP